MYVVAPSLGQSRHLNIQSSSPSLVWFSCFVYLFVNNDQATSYWDYLRSLGSKQMFMSIAIAMHKGRPTIKCQAATISTLYQFHEIKKDVNWNSVLIQLTIGDALYLGLYKAIKEQWLRCKSHYTGNLNKTAKTGKWSECKTRDCFNAPWKPVTYVPIPVSLWKLMTVHTHFSSFDITYTTLPCFSPREFPHHYRLVWSVPGLLRPHKVMYPLLLYPAAGWDHQT